MNELNEHHRIDYHSIEKWDFIDKQKEKKEKIREKIDLKWLILSAFQKKKKICHAPLLFLQKAKTK